MQSAPTHSAGAGQSTALVRSYRHTIYTLAYVRLDHANGGIIRNLSDSGMAIQAVGRLHPEQVVHLRFEFIRPRAKFEVVGQVAWANAAGQAGLRFNGVPLQTRRLLKDWMLTDLLTATTELTTWINAATNGEREDGLIISKLPLHPIRLARAGADAMPAPFDLLNDGTRVNISWWPVSIRPKRLARLVDGMMIISAVLLFSIIVVELTDVLPSWWALAGTEAALTVVFAVLYRYLCYLTMQATLGTRLAQLAIDGISEKSAVPSASEPH